MWTFHVDVHLYPKHSDLNFPPCAVDKGHFLTEVEVTNSLTVSHMLNAGRNKSAHSSFWTVNALDHDQAIRVSTMSLTLSCFTIDSS